MSPRLAVSFFLMTHAELMRHAYLFPLAFGLRSQAARNACFAASRVATLSYCVPVPLLGGLHHQYVRV